MTQQQFDPVPQLVTELDLPKAGVQSVLGLLAEGGTVPFIARYRKEATGGLDEVQIRDIQERHGYLKELEDRRQTILGSVEEQGKLTDELKSKLLQCTTKSALEDLYLPYKPKRRTRATIAREKGVEPLALRILEQPAEGNPLQEAAAFVDEEKGVESAEKALALARDIVAEVVSENAELRADLRQIFQKHGIISSIANSAKKEERSKFEQYYDFQEPVREIPSHRFLAIRRGEREDYLRMQIDVEEARVEPLLQRHAGLKANSPFADMMQLAYRDAMQRLLAPSMDTEIRTDLKLHSDLDAVEIFADNLRNLMLAAPMGERSVTGIDPGLRTGCKCVAVDDTGKFLEDTLLHLSKGEEAKKKAEKTLLQFVERHNPAAVAVGNGTGGRQTEAFVRKVLADAGRKDVVVVLVSESGASVYSASDLARKEFPDLDVTVRGAISIARRLQDPLAELVKIDPKSIGVGQYQHDVHQPLLARKLDEVVESCVNHVGAEANTASSPLLARIAGIGPKLAEKIVKHREETGLFDSRKSLLKVSGMGPRTYEQAAGFLRVQRSKNPLDASAVHPERYALVERIAKDMETKLEDLVGNRQLVGQIKISNYIGPDVGEPTLLDIIAELEKPGRDPRDVFEPPKFRDDVHEMSDLKAGMQFEGVVTNVTAFGAFVDIGVHQDGLVHISQLADRFVKDPREVVQAGNKLKVRVMEVDLERKRISLTARSGELPKNRSQQQGGQTKGNRGARPKPQQQQQQQQQARFSNNPFADAFKK